jgi:hypothetical protein
MRRRQLLEDYVQIAQQWQLREAVRRPSVLLNGSHSPSQALQDVIAASAATPPYICTFEDMSKR